MVLGKELRVLHLDLQAAEEDCKPHWTCLISRLLEESQDCVPVSSSLCLGQVQGVREAHSRVLENPREKEEAGSFTHLYLFHPTYAVGQTVLDTTTCSLVPHEQSSDQDWGLF